MYDRLDKNFFSIVQKYEYDVKVSRTRTFVRGQRHTKVRPCGRTLRQNGLLLPEEGGDEHVWPLHCPHTSLRDEDGVEGCSDCANQHRTVHAQTAAHHPFRLVQNLSSGHH